MVNLDFDNVRSQYAGIFPFILIGLILALYTSRKLKSAVKSEISKPEQIRATPVSPDFKWDEEQPAKSYPFKDREYKLTMGIRTFEADDWLLIEDTYLDRIEEKTKITTNTHEKYEEGKDLESLTVFTSEIGNPAISEFYDVVVQYMCDRYPQYFSLSEDTTEMHNKITGETIPAKSGDIEPRKLLHYMVRTIEEDFIIMMPDASLDDPEYGHEYYFKAGVFGFAAGFDPKDKINKPLTAIHEPIPGYQSKLRMSMNRYFEKLPAGKFVGRANFSVQAHDKFYVDDDNKGYHLTEEEIRAAIPYDSLDFNKQVHYRSERQMLTRLPKTGAIVFTIRTYLHPFCDFKTQPQEVSQRLLGALKKFPDDMAVYKGLTKLGPAAIRYLEEIQQEF